jgi:uncharacterized protein YbaP (TraB family)
MKTIVLALGTVLALALAAPASAEPALWKVQGPHATVYLFGTVHLLKSTTQWHSPKIDAAFASADTLWEEIANADDIAAAQPIIQQYGLDPAHPLSGKLDDAGKAKLAAAEAAFGLPASQLEPLQPWLAALTFQVLPIVKAGYDPKSGVDLALRATAVAQHKPVMGFETIDQQLHLFADLQPQLQVDYLLFMLGAADQSAGRLGELVDIWAAGDTTGLAALLNGDLFTRYPTLYRVLLVQRNRGFADKIEQLLHGSGTTFVAVGAGHLVGPDSVQADLAKDGITAVRQ